jgi:membrane protease YdiL (CAAX protease family)
LGVTLRNIFPSIYLSISLGIAFAIEGLLINFLKYNRFEFEANIGDSPFLIILGLSFVTAISEEVVFRGYIFNRLLEIIKKEWTANIISSLIWGLIHLPITLFWWKMDIGSSMGYIILITIFGMGSAFVFARTRNVFSSILLHVLWGWPILLFR